jgi:hypothetical protein
MHYNLALFLAIMSKMGNSDLLITYTDKRVNVNGVYKVDIYNIDSATGGCNHIERIIMSCYNCSNNIKLGGGRVTYDASEHFYAVNITSDKVYTIYNAVAGLPSERSDHFSNTTYMLNNSEIARINYIEESSGDFNISNMDGEEVLYVGRRELGGCLTDGIGEVKSYYYLEDKNYAGQILVPIDVPLAHITTYFLQTCARKCPNKDTSMEVIGVMMGVILGIGCIFYACVLYEINQCKKRDTFVGSK